MSQPEPKKRKPPAEFIPTLEIDLEDIRRRGEAGEFPVAPPRSERIPRAIYAVRKKHQKKWRYLRWMGLRWSCPHWARPEQCAACKAENRAQKELVSRTTWIQRRIQKELGVDPPEIEGLDTPKGLATLTRWWKRKRHEQNVRDRRAERREFPELVENLRLPRGTRKELESVPMFAGVETEDIIRLLIREAIAGKGEPYKPRPHAPQLQLDSLRGRKVTEVLPDRAGLRFDNGLVLTVDAGRSKRWMVGPAKEFDDSKCGVHQETKVCPTCEGQSAYRDFKMAVENEAEGRDRRYKT